MKAIDMNLPIFMDNNATTPVDPQVLEAMLPYFCEEFGNAASRNHAFGWRAEEAVDRAREQIARLIGAKPREIIFTSGATESDNLALKGVAEMYRDKGTHIVTQVTEHKAVLDSAKRLEREGFEITDLPVDRTGLVDPDDVRRALRETTILISIMAANNEIGTLQPVEEIGRIAKERGVLFHSDAAQALGKIPVDVEAWGVDLVSLSAHKMYGPKGMGALYVRGRDPRVRLSPMMDGGGHERGMRSGTLDVPGIVGFGAACELAYQEMEAEAERLRALRDRLQSGFLSQVDEVCLNGHPERRLPGTCNLSFAYVEGESLVTGLNDIALSSGSACTSVGHESSHV
ncbi:MAG: aminotransferase class V-fold PLP-dependent enzyme, partial [bacterium]